MSGLPQFSSVGAYPVGPRLLRETSRAAGRSKGSSQKCQVTELNLVWLLQLSAGTPPVFPQGIQVDLQRSSISVYFQKVPSLRLLSRKLFPVQLCPVSDSGPPSITLLFCPHVDHRAFELEKFSISDCVATASLVASTRDI